MVNKFGKIEIGNWYGTTVGYTSGKTLKGIMRLVEFDTTQDMLILERAENVGYGDDNGISSFTHAMMKDVSAVTITTIPGVEPKSSISDLVNNPFAIDWMKKKTQRNETSDDDFPPKSYEHGYKAKPYGGHNGYVQR